MIENLQKLDSYLNKRGYHPTTIYHYKNKVNLFFDWCDLKNINADTASLDDLYTYKRHLLDRNLKPHTIRELMSVLKHYYLSIERQENPALLVVHKKRATTLPQYLLSKDELLEIYRLVESGTIIQKRDKVIMGMLVFQGLKREEIDDMELSDLNLDDATIYVKSHSRTNARTLEIQSIQMVHLMSYIYEVRPKLLLETQKQTNKLFFSMGKGNTINNAFQLRLKKMKIAYTVFKSPTQIRESLMAIWIKQYGVRKAQYLSGIKYTSSMLRYKTTDIEKLKHKLSIIHPLERKLNAN